MNTVMRSVLFSATCPTGPSSVGGSGRELSAEQADNLHEPSLP